MHMKLLKSQWSRKSPIGKLGNQAGNGLSHFRFSDLYTYIFL